MQIIILLFMSFLIACNAEINTVNPQASTSIEASKRDRFFIKEYYLDNSYSNIIDIKEAWVEYKWKHKATLFKKSKIKVGGVQLNIKINSFKDSRLDESSYFINWEMEAPAIGIVGRGNGVYSLLINNLDIPDSLQINIKRGQPGKEFIPANSFKLYRKWQ